MTELAHATLTAKTDAKGKDIPLAQRKPIALAFNPEKLELSISNAMEANKEKRNKPQPPQFVTSSTAKLSLELVFDTTTDGGDVRAATFALASLMKPSPAPDKDNPKRGIPSVVIFEWGSFVFEGYIDTWRETLDFWSAEGIPLRATVSLAMTEHEEAFRPPKKKDSAADGAGDSVLPVQPGTSLDDLARRLGDVSASVGLALANGLESRRRVEVDLLAIPSVRVGGQASVGLAAGGAAGVGGGGIVASFGAQASAGGTLDAFAGLSAKAEIGVPRPRVELDAGFGAGAGFGVGAGIGLSASAGIGIGGKAGVSAGAGLTAEVGAAPGTIRIVFEEG
jgi:hypothetical protein